MNITFDIQVNIKDKTGEALKRAANGLEAVAKGIKTCRDLWDKFDKAGAGALKTVDDACKSTTASLDGAADSLKRSDDAASRCFNRSSDAADNFRRSLTDLSAALNDLALTSRAIKDIATVKTASIGTLATAPLTARPALSECGHTGSAKADGGDEDFDEGKISKTKQSQKHPELSNVTEMAIVSCNVLFSGLNSLVKSSESLDKVVKKTTETFKTWKGRSANTKEWVHDPVSKNVFTVPKMKLTERRKINMPLPKLPKAKLAARALVPKLTPPKGFGSGIASAIDGLAPRVEAVFARLGHRLPAAIKDIGPNMTAAIRGFGPGLAAAAKSIGPKMAAAIKGLGPNLAAAAKSVGPKMAAAAKGIGSKMGKTFAKHLPHVTSWTKKLIPGAAKAAPKLAGGFAGAASMGGGSAASGALSLMGVLKGLGSAIAAIPGWGWAIAAVIATIATVVYKYWEPIKGFFKDVWSGIKTGWDEYAGPAFDALKCSLGGIWDAFSSLLDVIIPVKSGQEGVNGAFSLGAKVGKALMCALTGIFKAAWFLSCGIEIVVIVVATLVDAVMEIFKTVAKAVVVIAKVFTSDSAGAADTWTSIGSDWSGVGSRFTDRVKNHSLNPNKPTKDDKGKEKGTQLGDAAPEADDTPDLQEFSRGYWIERDNNPPKLAGTRSAPSNNNTTINYNPHITLTGSVTPEAETRFAALLQKHKTEIADIVNEVNKRRARWQPQ